MALFARFFSPKKDVKKNVCDVKKEDTLPSLSSWQPFSYDKKQVRVLLFRECDIRGRKVLFDSNAMQKIPISDYQALSTSNSKADLFREVTNGYVYLYEKPNEDVSSLGEMVFGSVAMVYKGSSVKIHTLKLPLGIMFSKLDKSSKYKNRLKRFSERSSNDSVGSSVSSTGDYFPSHTSTDDRSESRNELDSGFGGEISLQSTNSSLDHFNSSNIVATADHQLSQDSLVKSSSGSISSLRRRWFRHITSTLALDPQVNANPKPSKLSLSGDKEGVESKKVVKVALSLIINLNEEKYSEMEAFVFENVALILRMISRLHYQVTVAYGKKETFFQTMMNAVSSIQQEIFDLFCAPRLLQPVWLTLTSNKSSREIISCLSNDFFHNFGYLLNSCDTKDSNFFLSTLLTAVLTHHLSWSLTIAYGKDGSENLIPALNHVFPYNACWAQTNDLQGAVGKPPKTSKTVIMGKSKLLIQRLLMVLSYFIRSNHVEKVNTPPMIISNDCSNLIDELVEKKKKKTKQKRQLKRCKTSESLSSFDGMNPLKSKIVELSELRNVEDILNPPSKGDSTTLTQNIQKLIYLFSMLPERKTFSSPNFFIPEETEEIGLTHLYEEDHQKRTKCPPLSKRVQLLNELNKSCKTSDLKFSKHDFNINQLSNSQILSRVDLNSPPQPLNYPSNQSIQSKQKFSDKVIFVLGENEQLINITNTNEVKVPSITVENFDDSKSMNPNNENENFAHTFIHHKIANSVSSKTVRRSWSDSFCCEYQTFNSYNNLLSDYQFYSESDVRIIQECSIEKLLCKSFKKNCGLKSFHSKNRNNYNFLKTLNSSKTKCNPVPVGGTPDIFSSNFLNSISTPTAQQDPDFFEVPIEMLDAEYDFDEINVGQVQHGSVSDHYISEFILQGVLCPENIDSAQNDLANCLHKEYLANAENDEESVCILGNTDTWEVQVISSNMNTRERNGSIGVQVGMSQLVANMTETLLHLCKLSSSSQDFLDYIESKLMELYLRSETLADFLLSVEFCDMETLTSSLELESSDVPLLLAVASVHTPEVAEKYGLSFR